MSMFQKAVSQHTFFRKPVQEEVNAHRSHAFGMMLAVVLVLVYSIHAVIIWATAPVVETYSAGDVRTFGPVDLTFNVSCPTCVVWQSTEYTSSMNESFRVWHGYDSQKYPHCSGAPEDSAVSDETVSVAALCYSSDDISESSGIVVSLWNMSTGGQGNRANVLVTGPSLVVNTPLEWWHEKTILLGMNVFRDQEDCTSAAQCELRRELYLGSMQYDGRVAGWPGAKLNIRLLRSAHVYTKAPGQTLWDVFGAIGGAYGLIVSLVSIVVSFLASLEYRAEARSRISAKPQLASDGMEGPQHAVPSEAVANPTVPI